MPPLTLTAFQPFSISGTGTAFPAHELSNEDVVRLVSPMGRRGERSDQEVAEVAAALAGVLGVERRAWAHQVGQPFADDEETTVDLMTRALEQALEASSVQAGDLAAIITATSTPAAVTRGNAPQVADRLGVRCAAFDLRAGCSGGVAALVQGAMWVSATWQPVAVVAADTFSKVIPPGVPIAALAMADGAGASVLRPSQAGDGLLAASLCADGSLAHLGTSPSPFPPTAAAMERGDYFLTGDPEELLRQAVPLYTGAIAEAMAGAKLSAEDVALYLPHQAGDRLIEQVARASGFPPERVYARVSRHANTGSASVLVALHEARAEGLAVPGATLVTAALGGGLCWGAAALRV